MSMKIFLKTPEEIELLGLSSLLVGQTLAEVGALIEPGMTTSQLDAVAETFIRDHHAEPAFKGYRGFPATLCCSPDEQVVHGIPNDKPLRDGQILSVDCGALLNGYYGDSAFTFAVGEVSDDIRKLMDVTRESLYKGIGMARAGNRIGDIGWAVQQHAEQNGFGVVRELVGHGVGMALHEAPEVPNFGKRGRGVKIKEGLVIAIEPMINMGKKHVRMADDGWTIYTADRKPSAHYEHTIAVTADGADVLSSFEWIDKVLMN